MRSKFQIETTSSDDLQLSVVGTPTEFREILNNTRRVPEIYRRTEQISEIFARLQNLSAELGAVREKLNSCESATPPGKT